MPGLMIASAPTASASLAPACAGACLVLRNRTQRRRSAWPLRQGAGPRAASRCCLRIFSAVTHRSGSGNGAPDVSILTSRRTSCGWSAPRAQGHGCASGPVANVLAAA